MYVYFDSQGVLREIVNDEIVRGRDVLTDTIHICFEDDQETTSKYSNASIVINNLNTTRILTRTTDKNEFPPNPNRDVKYFKDYKKYYFWEYSFQSGDLLEGNNFIETLCYIGISPNSQPVKAQGIITLNVENSRIIYDIPITQSQFDYLIALIGSETSSIILVNELPDEGIAGQVYCLKSNGTLWKWENNNWEQLTYSKSVIDGKENVSNKVNVLTDSNNQYPTTHVITNALANKADLVGGKVPSSQLPGYVDDVVEGYYYNNKFYTDAQHTTEIAGESGKIYIDLTTNKTYRWSGTQFVEISPSLALGETASTAYAGNKGKANADAIEAIKNGTTIDSFGDVENALNSISGDVDDNTQAIAGLVEDVSDLEIKIVELTGENGTLTNDEYDKLVNYDNSIIVWEATVNKIYLRKNFLQEIEEPEEVNTIYVSSFQTGENSQTIYVLHIAEDKTWYIDDFELNKVSGTTSDGSSWDTLTIGSITKNVNVYKGPDFIEISPPTSTQGTLSNSDFAKLISKNENYILLNNEIYRLNDSQHDSGYLVYTHVGQDSTNNFYIKCITITTSTHGWVMTQKLVDSTGAIRYDTQQSLTPAQKTQAWANLGLENLDEEDF